MIEALDIQERCVRRVRVAIAHHRLCPRKPFNCASDTRTPNCYNCLQYLRLPKERQRNIRLSSSIQLVKGDSNCKSDHNPPLGTQTLKIKPGRTSRRGYWQTKAGGFRNNSGLSFLSLSRPSTLVPWLVCDVREFPSYLVPKTSLLRKEDHAKITIPRFGPVTISLGKRLRVEHPGCQNADPQECHVGYVVQGLS